MKGKKIGTSILAAVMLAGTTAMPVLAAMPDKTVVIGEKAFSLSYANTEDNMTQIRDAVKASKGKGIFIKFNNKWFNNSEEVITDLSGIPAVAYTDGTVEKNFEAQDGDEATKGFQLVDVSAVGLKKVKVVFTEAADADKAAFLVKKGKTNKNVEKVEWNEDKTEATINLYQKITKGDYTVSVNGLELKENSKEIKAENEKVAEIKVLSEVAPIKVMQGGDYDVATVNYEKLNQYGEKTKIGTDYIQGGLILESNSAGVAKFRVPKTTFQNPLLKEYPFTVSIIVNNTFSKQSLVKAVKEAKISAVELGKVQVEDAENKKLVDKEITEGTRTIFVKMDLKDQYGRSLDKSFLGNAVVDNVATTDKNENHEWIKKQATIGGLTSHIGNKKCSYVYNPQDSKDKSLYLKVEGKFDSRVTETLMVLVGSQVKQMQIKSLAASKADEINITLPEDVVYGEKVKITEFSALDQNGKEIKGKDLVTVLNDTNRVRVTTGYGSITAKLNIETEKVELVWDLAIKDENGNPVVKTATEYAFLTIQTATNKIKNQQVSVVANAYPTSATLKSDSVMKTLVGGASNEVKVSNMKVYDQYDREMAHDKVVESGKLSVKFEGNVVPGKDTTTGGKADQSWTFAPGTKAGTTTATISLKIGTSVEETTFAMETVAQKDVVGLEVKAPETLYAGTTENPAGDKYAKTVSVYGKTSSGAKVLLVEGKHYTINKPKKTDFNAKGQLYVNAAMNLGTSKAGKAVMLVLATLDHSIPTQSRTINFSSVSPVLTSVKMKKDKTLVLVEGTEFSVVDVTDNAAIFEAKDQYGVSIESQITNILFTDIKKVAGSTFVVTGNGSDTARITGMKVGETAKVKIFFKNEKSLTFTIKKGE